MSARDPSPGGSEACPDENALAALGEGALDDAARAALESHLEACRRCALLITELASLSPVQELPARYRAVRRLGAGAMGVVWEADDTQLDRRVAVKLIAPEFAGDAALRARFLREARALAQLHHPNVIAVHDVGEHGDNLYITLALVSGATARAWLAAAARSAAEVLAVWRQAAAGLAAVHRAGLIHRDVKPDNVLVDDRGHVWLADLGLATQPGDDVMALTRSGAVIGTPQYMAPEQLAGLPATPRSDQFSLCAAIWEALAGARPFAGRTVAALAVAMTRPPAIPRGSRSLRRRLAVLARGLHPDPARRWPSIDALAGALAAVDAEARSGTEGRGAAWRTPVTAILVAALAAAFGALGTRCEWGRSHAPPPEGSSAAATAVARVAGILACNLEYETFTPSFAKLPEVAFREQLAGVLEHGVAVTGPTYQLNAEINTAPTTNLTFVVGVNAVRTGERVFYSVIPRLDRIRYEDPDGKYVFEHGVKIPPVTIGDTKYDFLRMYCAFHRDGPLTIRPAG